MMIGEVHKDTIPAIITTIQTATIKTTTKIKTITAILIIKVEEVEEEVITTTITNKAIGQVSFIIMTGVPRTKLFMTVVQPEILVDVLEHLGKACVSLSKILKNHNSTTTTSATATTAKAPKSVSSEDSSTPSPAISKVVSVVEQKPVKKPVRRPRDPNAPKRPPTAYFLFCKGKRKALAQEHPKMNIREINLVLSKLWENADQKPFHEDAERMMNNYYMKVADYEQAKRDTAIAFVRKSMVPVLPADNIERVELEDSEEAAEQSEPKRTRLEDLPSIPEQTKAPTELPTQEPAAIIPIVQPPTPTAAVPPEEPTTIKEEKKKRKKKTTFSENPPLQQEPQPVPPVIPAAPVTPVITATPAIPATPAISATPEIPATPAIPVTPVISQPTQPVDNVQKSEPPQEQTSLPTQEKKKRKKKKKIDEGVASSQDSSIASFPLSTK